MTPPQLQAQLDDTSKAAIEDAVSSEMPMTVIPRGGAREVGRSCYHIATPELNLLVDCGLKQGDGGQFPDLRGIHHGQIDAVFLTHAHIDHSGGLPVLEHRGLLADDAPIITTRPTTALAHTLLHDSIKIHIEETEQQGREQEFTRDDVHDVLERFTPQRHGEHELSRTLQRLDDSEDITYELGEAGHLLGSVWLALEYQNRRLLISGDLGGRSAHLPDIESPPGADTLLMESTYGDRQQHRSLKSARNHLYQETLKAIKDDIPVLIPTFAVGRAQEVMQIFRERFPQESEEVQDQLEVVYDGMARDATAAYHAFSVGEFVNESINNWRMNSQDPEPYLPDCAWYPEDNSERKPILDGDNAPIIVAPSGMFTGGTSPLYLTALVEHYDEARIFFTGYQAEGTPGRALQQATDDHVRVTLPVTPFPDSDLEPSDDGTVTVTVPTQWIQTISGFSGHCARDTLRDFAEDVDPEHLALVHGPPEAQKECQGYLDNRLDVDAVTRASLQTPIPVYESSSDQLSVVEDDNSAAPSTTVQPQEEPSAESDPSNTNDKPEAGDSKSDAEKEIKQLKDRIAELESKIARLEESKQLTESEIREMIREERVEEEREHHKGTDCQPDDLSVEILSELEGVGTTAISRLKNNGYKSITDVESASISELVELEQIGPSTAKKLRHAAQVSSNK